MAGDWIKMRGALLDHPKVIALARVLHDDREFREWLMPGSEMSGQTVSDAALRCVTTALLMKVWSVSREHGKFVRDDLVLTHSNIADLDQIAGAPGIGKAMEAIGWATKKGGVTLPNFIEFNVPMTAAEKQAEYRKRHKTVTEALPTRSNEKRRSVTTRVEKSREENNASLLRNSARAPTTEPQGNRKTRNGTFTLPGWIPEDAWQGYAEMRARIRKPMTQRAMQLAVAELEKICGQDTAVARAVLEQSIFKSWQGLFALKANGAMPDYSAVFATLEDGA